MHVAGRRLIQIDQSKSDIEIPYLAVVMSRDHYPRDPEKNVEYVVGRSSAREAFIFRDQEAGGAYEDEYGSKDDKHPIIEIRHSVMIDRKHFPVKCV